MKILFYDECTIYRVAMCFGNNLPAAEAKKRTQTVIMYENMVYYVDADN